VTAPYIPRFSRRETLQWLAAVPLMSALPVETRAQTSTLAAFRPTAAGYGADPNLKSPIITWPLIMVPHQLQLTAVVSDLILPASAKAPAPSTIGVPDFVNEWVSAPYPEQVQDRETILGGLAWIDTEATRSQQRSFLELDHPMQNLIIDDIARSSGETAIALQGTFFERLRFLVVSAYYTTPEGFKDIGYTGNIPLSSYPPITDEERKILDKAFFRLGL
jgi:hypothetical protein